MKGRQEQGSTLRGSMLAYEPQSHSPVEQSFLPSVAAAKERLPEVCVVEGSLIPPPESGQDPHTK